MNTENDKYYEMGMLEGKASALDKVRKILKEMKIELEDLKCLDNVDVNYNVQRIENMLSKINEL